MSKNHLKIYNSEKNFDILFNKFMFYFFKIFGIATISYDHVWSSKQNRWILFFKSSWIEIIYNIVLLCILTPIMFVHLDFFYENKIFGASHRETVIYIASALLFMFGTIITLVFFIFQHANIKSVANKIIRLKNLTKENWVLNKLLFTFFLVNYLTSFSVIILLFSSSNRAPIFYIIGIYISFYEILFLMTQYTLILKIIKDFFKFLNNELNEVLLKQPHLTIESLELCLKIDKLMHFYSCLCDVSEDISNLYSLPMAWAILNAFNVLVVTTHFLINRIFVSNYCADILVTSLILIYLTTVTLTTLVINATNTIKEVLYVAFVYADAGFILYAQKVCYKIFI